MGLLVDGVWKDEWYDTKTTKGKFVRADSLFRNWVTAWYISFSYGRALQASCLFTWSGKAENTADAQQAFLKRARLNGAATTATYSSDME